MALGSVPASNATTILLATTPVARLHQALVTLFSHTKLIFLITTFVMLLIFFPESIQNSTYFYFSLDSASDEILIWYKNLSYFSLFLNTHIV